MGKLNLSLIATIVPLIIVAIGLVGWVLTLRADVTSANKEITGLHAEIDTMHERLDEEFNILHQTVDEEFNILHQEVDILRDIQSLQENEMRTIMADHSGFNEVLKQLGKSGLLPSGERREYGGYSN